MPPALRFRNRAPDQGAHGYLPWLAGPSSRLPGIADRIAEGWWRLTPRARGALALLAAGALLAVAALRIALSPYGPPVTVLVATSDLVAGSVPAGSEFTSVRWPRDLLPPGLPASRADVAGSRLVTDVTAGSVLTLRHLRDSGPLADLSPGAAAIALPQGLVRTATAGTRLDLVAVAGDGSGRLVARDVRVLAVEDGTVWAEVPRERAADVAAAALRGTLSAAVLAD